MELNILLTFAFELILIERKMFGIEDPLIIMPYILSVACVLFSAWFGLKYWNKDDEKDK